MTGTLTTPNIMVEDSTICNGKPKTAELNPSSMVAAATISLPEVSPAANLLHFLRQNGTVEVCVREPNGGATLLDAAGCVARIQACLASVSRAADAHAGAMLEMGWLLLQVRRHFPRGAWLPWLRTVGLHGKRAQEWMRLAAEFAHVDGSPDLTKLQGAGVLGEHGRVIASYTKIRGIVRSMRSERREAQGLTMPGKPTGIDEVLAGELDGDDDDTDDELFDEPEAPALSAEERAARASALRRSLMTDDESDLLPGTSGATTAANNSRDMASVPSESDSGTNAPVHTSGVAPVAAGRSAATAPGKAESTMVQEAPAQRGASGEQITIEGYLQEIVSKQHSIAARMRTLVAELEVNRLDGETVMKRMDLAERALSGQLD